MIIAGSSHPELASEIAAKLSLPITIVDLKKFEDQELRIQINAKLQDQDVIIIQSTSKPANDHIMELLLIADTAKRAGARRITAVIPYFGYSRQDRPSYEHGPISASLVARLIEAAGIDQVITLDLHSKQIEGFFKIGVKNLETFNLFAPLLDRNKDYVVVSPDIGGVIRAQKFSALLNCDLAVINKTRPNLQECSMNDIIGNVEGKNCIIIDDIIDTGNTICCAAELLIGKGAKSVIACATHGVFSGDCIRRLDQSMIEAVYITDTIKQPALTAKFKVIKATDFIATNARIDFPLNLPSHTL